MPVFISHRTIDKAKATDIFNLFTIRRVNCYVDSLVGSLKSSNGITSVIMTWINQYTHMMTVISTYTQGTWWAHVEIDIVSKADRHNTSNKISYADLPEFLCKWPIIKDQSDLDKFTRKYKMGTFFPLLETLKEYLFLLAEAAGIHPIVK